MSHARISIRVSTETNRPEMINQTFHKLAFGRLRFELSDVFSFSHSRHKHNITKDRERIRIIQCYHFGQSNYICESINRILQKNTKAGKASLPTKNKPATKK